MGMEIFKRFDFDAAHHLPHVPTEHKCHGMHGHHYEVTLHVAGPVDSAHGWITDYADVAAVFGAVRSDLDHTVLNEIEGLANPTSEVLAMWIWDRCQSELPGLAAVTVQESPTSGCVYRPSPGADRGSGFDG